MISILNLLVRISASAYFLKLHNAPPGYVEIVHPLRGWGVLRLTTFKISCPGSNISNVLHLRGDYGVHCPVSLPTLQKFQSSVEFRTISQRGSFAVSMGTLWSYEISESLISKKITNLLGVGERMPPRPDQLLN